MFQEAFPKRLPRLGLDVRIVLPYYQGIKTQEAIYYKSTVRINETEVNLLENRSARYAGACLASGLSQVFQTAGKSLPRRNRPALG